MPTIASGWGALLSFYFRHEKAVLGIVSATVLILLAFRLFSHTTPFLVFSLLVLHLGWVVAWFRAGPRFHNGEVVWSLPFLRFSGAFSVISIAALFL